MEPRERWLAVLNREKPDRIPMDYRATAEASRRLLDYMGLDILGAKGGYILGPCHNLQAVSRPESIVAMYEAGFECGWM